MAMKWSFIIFCKIENLFVYLLLLITQKNWIFLIIFCLWEFWPKNLAFIFLSVTYKFCFVGTNIEIWNRIYLLKLKDNLNIFKGTTKWFLPCFLPLFASLHSIGSTGEAAICGQVQLRSLLLVCFPSIF